MTEMINLTRFLSFILVLMFLFCFGIEAQAVPMESEQQKIELRYQEPQNAETPSILWSVIRTILALAFILVLAWGSIRIFGGNLRGRLHGSWIRVLDEVTLGPNRGIVVIEVGGKAFLVGITDHNVSMLGELNDPQLIEEMIVASRENQQVASNQPTKLWNSVKEQLLSGLHKKNPARGFNEMVDQRMQTLDKMSDRLKHLQNLNIDDDRWKK